MEILEIRWLSLAIFAPVAVGMAVFLGLTVAVARKIDQHTAAVWTIRRQIAGHKASSWMLDQTNRRLSRMAGSLDAVEEHTRGVEESRQPLAQAGGVRR